MLDRFLAGVERRAYRMAHIATGNADDALDIVQDAMIKLAEKYGTRDESDWGPLFYRILYNRIKDYYRRNTLYRRLFKRFWGDDADNTGSERELEDPRERNPEQLLQTSHSIDKLDEAIRELPVRQQQAFLLRVWDGMDIRETARIMACSEGSVKTHYSRAIQALRKKLGDYY